MSPANKPAPFLERAKKDPIGSAEFLQSTPEEFSPEPDPSLVPAQPLNAAVITHAPASNARRTQRAEVQDAKVAKVMSGIVTAASERQKTDRRAIKKGVESKTAGGDQ